MSESDETLPTDPYDQGVYDAANGNPIGPYADLSWPNITTEAQLDAYNAGYRGEPRPE